MNKVREISKCILIGFDFLHREHNIIHTDLKPEKVLLVSTIDPVRSGLNPILERPKGNTNAAVSSLIDKKLKWRARRAVAKMTCQRGSMGGI